jgi:hypothetical protein
VSLSEEDSSEARSANWPTTAAALMNKSNPDGFTGPNLYGRYLPGRRGFLRPYVLFNRNFVAHGADQRYAHAIISRDLDGFRVAVNPPELGLVVHELLHPVVERVMDSRSALEEIGLATGPLLGVRWDVRRTRTHDQKMWEKMAGPIKDLISEYAGDCVEEFLTEALTDALLNGHRASAVSNAVRSCVDRRFRFDAVGIDELQALLHNEFEQNFIGRRSARAIYRNQIDTKAWAPIHHAVKHGEVLDPVPWIPLDITGHHLGRVHLITSDNLLANRVKQSSDRFWLAADPDLPENIAFWGLTGQIICDAPLQPVVVGQDPAHYAIKPEAVESAKVIGVTGFDL